MQSVNNLIKYTKHIYSSQWGIDVDTIVLRDSEFETLSKQNICYVHGVRIVPETYILDDTQDGDEQPDLGYFVNLLRK